MIQMIRKWLRTWLGMNSPEAIYNLAAIEIRDLTIRVESLEKEVQALKYQREQRERKRFSLHDWEQLQAEFASDPQNFKES